MILTLAVRPSMKLWYASLQAAASLPANATLFSSAAPIPIHDAHLAMSLKSGRSSPVESVLWG